MAIQKSIVYTGQDKTDTLDSSLRIEDGNKRMVMFDGSVNRMIVGTLPDNSIGMYVSKPGVDVNNATKDQLIFNSSQDIFKIVAKTQITLVKPANSSFGSIQVAHNLGYQPAFTAYCNLVNSYFQTPFTQLDTTFGTVVELSRIEVDDINIYAVMYAPNANSNPFYTFATTRVFTVYLLQETAS